MNLTPVVKNIILLNILVFVACLIYPELTNILAMHYFSNPEFKPWQIITHMFTHANPRESAGNIFHILFNMFALYSFGSILERVLGSKRFAILYLFSGFGAIFFHTAISFIIVWSKVHTLNLSPEMFLNPQGIEMAHRGVELTREGVSNLSLASIYFSNLIGASGAIYGLLAGFGYLFPNTPLMFMFVPVPIKAKYMIPAVLILYDVFYGQMGHDNVAHYAHIGGALFGFLLVLFWNKTNKRTFY